jgi:hypothetical protein
MSLLKTAGRTRLSQTHVISDLTNCDWVCPRVFNKLEGRAQNCSFAMALRKSVSMDLLRCVSASR